MHKPLSIEDQFKIYFRQKYEKEIQNIKLNNNKIKVVILCSGCYCPPHLGHYTMMEQAIFQLKSKYDIDFLFGIFSVASDAYMLGKIKDHPILFDKRKQLLEEIITEKSSKEHPQKLFVDDFEKNKQFIDYPELCSLYRYCLNQYNIKLAYCVGSDLMKYDIHLRFKEFADFLIIFKRDQMKIDEEIKKKEDLIFLENEQTKSLNSTQIRSLFSKFKYQ